MAGSRYASGPYTAVDPTALVHARYETEKTPEVEGPALCVNLEPRADLEGRALITEASCALGVPLSVGCGPSSPTLDNSNSDPEQLSSSKESNSERDAIAFAAKIIWNTNVRNGNEVSCGCALKGIHCIMAALPVAKRKCMYRVWEHCGKEVSIRVYKEHKRLYYSTTTNSWTRVHCDIPVSSSMLSEVDCMLSVQEIPRKSNRRVSLECGKNFDDDEECEEQNLPSQG